jgi:hypothetical protein
LESAAAAAPPTATVSNAAQRRAPNLLGRKRWRA